MLQLDALSYSKTRSGQCSQRVNLDSGTCSKLHARHPHGVR